MAIRKTRSDKRVQSINKELGVKLLNANGKPEPVNKKLGTIRKERAELTDLQKAAKLVVKSHPKEDKTLAKKLDKIFKAQNGGNLSKPKKKATVKR